MGQGLGRRSGGLRIGGLGGGLGRLRSCSGVEVWMSGGWGWVS